jgi:thiamine pyrophosphokinase
MSRFAILLGGDLIVTPRLKSQLQGARFIAADSGMMHAAALRVVPELWVGDFDSAGSELAIQYRDVPRETFPADKDATDGAIAIDEALRRGARDIVLIGGLGGQADHAAAVLGQCLRLARGGISCLVTSGTEEAVPVLAGTTRLDLVPGTRLSIIPFADLTGLDLEGVKWPLAGRAVPLGSTLTLSNVAAGPVTIGLQAGYGMAISCPPFTADD